MSHVDIERQRVIYGHSSAHTSRISLIGHLLAWGLSRLSEHFHGVLVWKICHVQGRLLPLLKSNRVLLVLSVIGRFSLSAYSQLAFQDPDQGLIHGVDRWELASHIEQNPPRINCASRKL